MHAIGTGRSDIGRTRKRNEDRFHIDNDLGFFIVADGVGGQAHGDLAAQIAVHSASEHLVRMRSVIEQVRSGDESPEDLSSIARHAVEAANRAVFEKAMSDSSHAGMGCTMTILLVSGSRAVMAHVGDTRLYLYRDGEAHQLSTDHTFTAALVEAGLLAEERVKNHPYSHVLTRVVGSQEATQIDTLRLDVALGDRFLLCSDGLTVYMDDADWLAEQLDSGDLEEIPSLLIKFANSGGGSDNITVVVAEIEADTDEESLEESLGTEIQDKLEALYSVFLFEDLSLADLAHVMSASTVLDYRTDESVIESGKELATLLVIVEGQLEVTFAGEILTVLGPGDHVGALSLIVPRIAQASLRTNEPSRLLSLEADAFQGLVRQQPWLGIELLERLGRKLTERLDDARDGFEDGTELVTDGSLTGLT